MPGPGTHILVSDKVAERLAELQTGPYGGGSVGNNNSPSALANLATTHANYYALGAVGPDLCF